MQYKIRGLRSVLSGVRRRKNKAKKNTRGVVATVRSNKRKTNQARISKMAPSLFGKSKSSKGGKGAIGETMSEDLLCEKITELFKKHEALGNWPRKSRQVPSSVNSNERDGERDGAYGGGDGGSVAAAAANNVKVRTFSPQRRLAKDWYMDGEASSDRISITGNTHGPSRAEQDLFAEIERRDKKIAYLMERIDRMEKRQLDESQRQRPEALHVPTQSYELPRTPPINEYNIQTESPRINRDSRATSLNASNVLFRAHQMISAFDGDQQSLALFSG